MVRKRRGGAGKEERARLCCCCSWRMSGGRRLSVFPAQDAPLALRAAGGQRREAGARVLWRALLATLRFYGEELQEAPTRRRWAMLCCCCC
uniref:Uncharacterized protein n=1 Tax=Oryza brachyantha TaxID=4533 RepID=J3M6Y9_ORYBR